MKVIAVVCFALLIASSCAVGVHNKMTNAQLNKMNALKADKGWSSIIINLAELHLMAEGPLDELIAAIEEVIDDLNRKLTSADEEYQKRTVQHDEDVKRIQGEIDSANTDIANSTSFLENVLKVQKANLESDIANLQQHIAETQAYIAEQTNIRQTEHAEFESKTIEHNEAVAALDEALSLLATLQTGDASLAQIKKAKSSLAKVQKKLKSSVESTFIKALVALSTSEFANGDAIRQVGDLMNHVRQNLIESLAKFTAEEEADQANFTTDIANKEADIARMNGEITTKSKELEQVNSQIDDTVAFINIRTADLSSYTKDLADENTSFEEATKAYQDLVAEFHKELSACNEALTFIQNADISGYIGDRMTGDAPYVAKGEAQLA